jgi:hypothetical protein
MTGSRREVAGSTTPTTNGEPQGRCGSRRTVGGETALDRWACDPRRAGIGWMPMTWADARKTTPTAVEQASSDFLAAPEKAISIPVGVT